MGKNTETTYAFRDITIPELKSHLGRGADMITAVHFAGNPNNVPVFHIFDVRLVLHPELPRIGHHKNGRIVWFEIYGIRDARSALLQARKLRRNGYVETIRMRSAFEV
ncbi:MAG: hypothetical protein HGA31_06325 [Candidatus Moranbacteria bacterium]|nr:hypothetical protein [Candidatus Moranbacteria bacterium]